MKQALLVGLFVMAVGAGGCMTVASQAYSTATGASPRFYELRDLGGPAVMDSYPSVVVQEFDPSPMLGAIPPAMPTDTVNAIVEHLQKSRMFEHVGTSAGPRPALVIRGKFVDYDPGGSGLRAVGFASNPFLTAQIEVVDASGGRVLGVAMVTGTIKSIARTGPNQLAEGVGKAVKSLLEHHHTKVEK